MDLNQKNVVYVGGCGGIGSATCKLLLKKKIAKLVVLDVIENSDLIKEFEAINPSAKVYFLKIDIRCRESVKKVIDEVISRIERIDVLVNGSGLSNELDADLTIGVNLVGLMHTTFAVLPLMDKSKGNGGGIIVNIASVAGLDPSAHLPVYNASKAGVVHFSRSLAAEPNFSQTGVSVITICPGLTRTGLLDQFKSEKFTERSEAMTKAINGIKNQGPDDLAEIMVEAIERNKNGAAYICDMGKLLEITFPRYWQIPTGKSENINAI